MSQYLRLESRLSMIQSLERHWNEKLSPSDTNPYPLAPKDLVSRGLVNQENYTEQNALFGRFCSSHMMREIGIFTCSGSMGTLCPVIELFGAGRARDCWWVADAACGGFKMRVRDISAVALSHMNFVLGPYITARCIDVVEGEIEEGFIEKPIDSQRTIAYFASQFIQVQKRRKMQRLLSMLGSFLEQWPYDTGVKPRIYLVHPFNSDNCNTVVWNGHELPHATWGDTIPYERHEITRACERGTRGKKVLLDVLGQHKYYHQCYSFARVTIAGT
jgi:hypothetical protein